MYFPHFLHIDDLPRKQFWFSVIFFISTILFWLLVFLAFLHGIKSASFIVFLLILGLAWVVLYTLSLLFLNKRVAFWLYAAFIFWLVILFGFHGWTIMGILFLALTMYLTRFKVERTRSFLSNFNAFFISKKALSIFFTGLALFLSLVYQSLVLQDISSDLKISPRVYHVIFMPAEFVLHYFVPGYTKGMTIDEIQDVIVNSFITGFIFKNENLKEEIPKGNIENELESTKTYNNSQTLEEFTLLFVNSTIERTIEPYSKVWTTIFIIGLFLVARFLLWPFMWLSILAVLLAIKLLSLYNILTIKKLEVVKEIPVLE